MRLLKLELSAIILQKSIHDPLSRNLELYKLELENKYTIAEIKIAIEAIYYLEEQVLAHSQDDFFDGF